MLNMHTIAVDRIVNVFSFHISNADSYRLVKNSVLRRQHMAQSTAQKYNFTPEILGKASIIDSKTAFMVYKADRNPKYHNPTKYKHDTTRGSPVRVIVSGIIANISIKP